MYIFNILLIKVGITMSFIKNLFKKENQEEPEIKFTPQPLQIAISTILVST